MKTVGWLEADASDSGHGVLYYELMTYNFEQNLVVSATVELNFYGFKCKGCMRSMQ
jgi:hypothetical protein